MSLRVKWLAKGHITHGYRRVFVIADDASIRHIVVFVPMPYESVFLVQQKANGAPMEDPSLWWGLSIIKKQIQDGILLAENEAMSDDGYLQTRPPFLTDSELLPITRYQDAIRQGYIELDQLRGDN